MWNSNHRSTRLMRWSVVLAIAAVWGVTRFAKQPEHATAAGPPTAGQPEEVLAILEQVLSEGNWFTGQEIFSDLKERLNLDFSSSSGFLQMNWTAEEEPYVVGFDYETRRFTVTSAAGETLYQGSLVKIDPTDQALVLHVEVESLGALEITAVEPITAERGLVLMGFDGDIGLVNNAAAVVLQPTPSPTKPGPSIEATQLIGGLQCGCYWQGIGWMGCGFIGCIMGYQCEGDSCHLAWRPDVPAVAY